MRFKKTTKGIGGTCLQGEIKTTYAVLVYVFGPPHNNGDGCKVDAEWRLRFEDGTVATIYNYKDGHSYLGDNGLDVDMITNWHVGGKTTTAVSLVKEALNNKPTGIQSDTIKRLLAGGDPEELACTLPEALGLQKNQR